MIMKKKLFFAAVAIVALASCADNEFVGEVSPNPNPENDGTNAIVFNSGAYALTRADKTGAEAAKALNNAFVVGGFKGASSIPTAAGTIVFDNYNVQYTANTANTTESNTNNWEYVGLDQNPLSSIYVANEKQTIKYWDFSNAQYDFIAYSLGNGGATATPITPETANTLTVPEGKENAGAYTISGTTAQLKTVHVADLVTVKKTDYNKVVNLTFRSLVSKVRVALYETIPGYSVKDVKFYSSDAAIDGGSTSGNAVLYTASTASMPTGGKYTVYFPTLNKQKTDKTASDYDSDANNAHVSFTTTSTTTTSTTLGLGALDEETLVVSQKYEHKEDDAESNPTKDADTKYLLGRASTQATFAGSAAPYYVDVLPMETGASLTLKVDYTLVSIDGSGENIKVVGAKAVVPAIYAQWKPGYAYTYLFKISDNSNGYTSGEEGTDPTGLLPITFDAVVVDAEEFVQETITTVATPSITTYQPIPANTDPATIVTNHNEYIAGDVYAYVMNGGTPITDLNSTTKGAVLYSLNREASEAEVMDALLMRSKVDGTTLANTTIYGRNGLVLTPGTFDNEIANEGIPGADGNKIAVADGAASKLTVASGTCYAYVYISSLPTSDTSKNKDLYEVVPVTVGTTNVKGYYTLEGSTYTEITAETTAATGVTYYDKYSVNDGTYAVKVIKCQ